MWDEDAVWLCLLIASELVFMGKEKINFLTKHIMWLVDNFDAWNAYPWGEYMWEKFYQRTVNAVSRHTEHHLAELKKNLNFNATYNLYGFAWAFKIWILESYPNSQKWWSKKANVIPRGLAWSKVTMFEKFDYDRLFGPLSIPNVGLISSPEEMRQAWFMASVDFIQGLADQDGNFLQDAKARENCIEHHNGMCDDTEDGNFVEGVDETICQKINQVSVEEGDGVLDSKGDGVHLSQTNDVIQQAVNLSTMSSTSPQARNAAVAEFLAQFYALKNSLKTDVCTENQSTDFNPQESEEIPNFCSDHNDTSNHIGGVSNEAKQPSSSSSHPRNDEDASHLDDLKEIDVENANDDYSNSQHHLHLFIKALDSKTENPTIDVVVPPKDDDRILRTIKPNDACDEVEVDNFEDDYMFMLNDEEKPVKSSLNDMELEQEPDKIVVKQGILEQQPNAAKGKTTILEETVGVKVEEKPSLGRGLGPLKVKKKNCQRALRPNYVLRSAQVRKKKLAMALKPPFGQQSATTPAPKKKIQDYENRSYCAAFRFRDWAIVSPYFSTSILSGIMPDYFSNGHMYPLPWIAVEKVYFPVNEPKKHWCLAELEIRNGVVTFYDSLGWAGGSRRRWWRQMKKLFPEKLTVYLLMHGIFESKGISADDYKITYKYAAAPFQASLFGDCRIWVCIFIYRLCRNLPVTVDDPLETALAYRERMLEYFWNHKIQV
ncbi:phospholipase-like protein [Tanacetum coccineum]